MASKGVGTGTGTGNGEDFEEADVAAAASRLMNLVAAPQTEDVEVKKRGVLPSERTMVQEDGVLKEKVRNQEKARTAWETKWTTVALSEKMFREEMAKIGVDPRPSALRPRPSCPPDISVPTSPPIPKLSSGLVGWRSTDPKFSLELFGPLYTSPVHTIDPPVTEDDLPRNKQFFIKLG